MSQALANGSQQVRPREWGRRLLGWFDKGVAKVPPEYRDAVQHHVYTALSNRLFDTRRTAQNRLAWHWNRQISDWSGYSGEWAHGKTKMEVLAPLYMEWGADYARMMTLGTEYYEYLNLIDDEEKRIRFTAEWLRSKDVTVKRFAEYLTRAQQYWAEQGIILESSEEMFHAAVGRHN